MYPIQFCSPLVTKRKCSSTTEYLLSYRPSAKKKKKKDFLFIQAPKDRGGIPTDQDDVLGALLFVLQLTDIKVRVVRRFEWIRALHLLALLKVRDRRRGLLQKCWTQSYLELDVGVRRRSIVEWSFTHIDTQVLVSVNV
jgi:hypothetical protein